MKRRLPRLRRLALGLAALYAAASCVGCAVVNAAMFHPPKPPYGPDLPGLVEMGTPDAPVAGVWSPAPGATRAVLFSHGNAEDLRYVHDRLSLFNRLGFSALAWDYPGYGRTLGKPSERAVYAAAEAAFRHLVEERGFAPSNIVVCGYSIGSGPACYLAEKHPDVGALLLVAPFKSAVRVVTRVRILPFDPFPNLARVPRTRCPVLVLHGTADRIIPSWHGEAVAAAAGSRGRFVPVPGATHVSVFHAAFSDPAASATLRAFLAHPHAESAEFDSHAESAEFAESDSHAESAENAEPRPGEAGPLPEGAAERSEAGEVSHAEFAESDSHAESAENAEPRSGGSGAEPPLVEHPPIP